VAQQCEANLSESNDPIVEVLGGLGVIRLSADAFVDLSVNERKMAYWFMQAVGSADSILYDQRSPHGLSAKALAEDLGLHTKVVPVELRPKVESLVMAIFAHKGPRDSATRERLAFDLTRSELEIAVVAAWKDGARFGGQASEVALKTWLRQLESVLFDDTEPPPPNRKGAGASRYAKERGQIAAALRAARDFAPPNQQRLLDLQIAFVEQSTDESRAAYQAEWAVQSFPIDLVMGFLGPVTPSGDREFVVHLFLADRTLTNDLQGALDTLRTVFVNTSPRIVTTRTVRPVLETPLVMGSRTTSPVALYPSTDPIKMLVAPVANTATWGLFGTTVVQAFLGDTSREADVRRCLGPSQRTLRSARAMVAMPSSSVVPGVIADIHAETMVLASAGSFVSDGLLPDRVCVDLLGDVYLMSYLLSLGGLSVDRSDGLGGFDVSKTSSTVVAYALERGAVKEVVRNGYSHLEVSDRDAWLRAVGSLRDETKGILERADGVMARSLLTRRNGVPEGRWARSAREHLQALGVPRTIVWQPPVLQAIRDEAGVVQDVSLDETASWIDAQLVWAGRLRAK